MAACPLNCQKEAAYTIVYATAEKVNTLRRKWKQEKQYNTDLVITQETLSLFDHCSLLTLTFMFQLSPLAFRWVASGLPSLAHVWHHRWWDQIKPYACAVNMLANCSIKYYLILPLRSSIIYTNHILGSLFKGKDKQMIADVGVKWTLVLCFCELSIYFSFVSFVNNSL